VVIQRLVMRDWKSGKIAGEASTGDFKEKFGSNYYGCVRADLHERLKKVATGQDGIGRPVLLKTDWKCIELNEAQGEAIFENGERVVADLIIGVDGVNVGVN
jgi:salicylate hydroxylase